MSTATHTSSTKHPGPPRRRRWPAVVVCVLLLAAVPVVCYLYIAWADRRDEEAAVAEIAGLDPRWRIADILADRKPVPDQENPALIAVRVDALMRPSTYDIGEDYKLFENDWISPAHRLNDPQIAVLRKELTKHVEAVTLARTLKDYSGEGRFAIRVAPDYITTNLEVLQRNRPVMYMLQHDAMLRAEDADAQGSLESCQALLVAARAIGDEPYIRAALIRVAGASHAVDALERSLAQGEPPAEQLMAMQELLVKEIDAGFFVQAVRGMRGGTDAAIEALRRGDLDLRHVRVSTVSGAPGGGLHERLEDAFPSIVLSGRAEQLRLMNQAVEAAKLPVEQQGKAFEEVEAIRKSSNAPLVRLLGHYVNPKVVMAHRLTKANLRCAVVALAAERFRQQEKRWPLSMDALVKAGYLAAVPLDPFDGQPLRYKATTDGVTVYSVGLDGVDNGGAINRENALAPDCDQGFRLWNLDMRRQPPLPVRPKDEG